jgi:parallel beta-helix repeat protein
MNKAVSGIMLSLLILTSMLTLAFNIKPTKAEWSGTVQIRADGSIDPPTAPIRSDRDVYTFTDNIFGSIIVKRNNIIIDGKKFVLKGTGDGIGFYLEGIFNVTIRNVCINYFGWGICLYESLSNTIYGNDVTKNEYGIKLIYSSYNCIFKNHISENSNDGVYLYRSSNNSISENDIVKNKNGIYLYESPNNSIFMNNVTNHECGIYFMFSNDNIIYKNEISHSLNGIYFLRSSNNIFHHNFLINNTKQVYDCSWDDPSYAPSINVWDHGYPSGGNYWSDYMGVDEKSGPNQDQLGGDGIGDIPYIIDKNNIDHYPLMHTYRSNILQIVNVDVPKVAALGSKITAMISTIYLFPRNKEYFIFVGILGYEGWLAYNDDWKTTVYRGNGSRNFFLSFTPYEGTYEYTVYAYYWVGNEWNLADKRAFSVSAFGWQCFEENVTFDIRDNGEIFVTQTMLWMRLGNELDLKSVNWTDVWIVIPNVEAYDVHIRDITFSGNYIINNIIRNDTGTFINFKEAPYEWQGMVKAEQTYGYEIAYETSSLTKWQDNLYVIRLDNQFAQDPVFFRKIKGPADPYEIWRYITINFILPQNVDLREAKSNQLPPKISQKDNRQVITFSGTSNMHPLPIEIKFILKSNNYILHVQSYPINGVHIAYTGDHSGTGITNFDIGPKDSPFTVTLTASLTYQDYTFDHWELDGVKMGETSLLTVKVDDERRERTAIAVYSRLQLDILSFLVDKTTKTYTIGTESVKFNVTLHNKLSSDAKCWVRIKLILPTPDKDKGYTQIIDTDPYEVNVPAQKDNSKIISWNIPTNCYPGTVIAIAQIFDSNPNEVTFPNIIFNKMLLLMLEKRPDISYVEIFGTEDHKLIHVHLQPYAFGTPFEYYYDWVTFWTAVDVVTEFNLIAFIELLKRVPTYLQKAINLASSEPYDLTIFQIYDQVGFAFEAAPATLEETTLTEVALYIGWEMAKNKLNLKGGIPRPPLENFIPIPKEFLEQPVPFYSQLHLPLMMNVEWLTPIPNTIERGRTIEIRVKASDPETKEPLDGATVHAIIGPEVGTYTRSTLLLWQVGKGIYSSQYYFSGDCQTGLWTIQVMANVPPKNGKRGFLGISSVKSIFVGSEISPIDIKTLDIKAEPLTIGKEEYVKVTVNCTICSSQIQSYDVRVAVWEKRNFLWLFDWDNKLREDAGSLKSITQILSQTYWEYTNIFQIKGSEMGWDLGPVGKQWVVGEHMLYATISVSWTPPDSTQVHSIGRTSYCVKVTVTGDEQPLNANVIVLTEKGQKLYLNVYDSKGRRVGFDASSNFTIIEVPGAYYNHGTNWTLIILPPDISDFRCLIDAKSAHETIEEYHLTIASIKNGEIKKETLNGVIEKGKIFEVRAKVEEGGIKIVSKGFIEERPLNILLITSLIIGATCVMLIVIAINARRKRKLC